MITYSIKLQQLLKLLCVLLCLLALPDAVYAQSQEMTTVTGIVTDENGEPLPGVSIAITGTVYGTSSDDKGLYALRIPKSFPSSGKIRFSMIGMKTVDVEYGNRERINIKMQENSHDLQEVVVTGVYNMPRRDMVGSYVTIKADSILMPAYNSIDEMLQGQVAGMIVKMPMRAGAAPDITIRGQSTLLGSTAPLWVVDGVIQPSVQQTSGWWDGWGIDDSDVEINNIIGSQISWLNPLDIESITVLKDASATAVYGSRAANGVIVVTTKKGVADRLAIRASYNLTVGEQLNYGLYNLMNSQERINFSKSAYDMGAYYKDIPIPQMYTYEGMYNLFLMGKLSEEDFIRQYNYLETVNTDWLKMLTRQGINQNYSVSASGGTAKSTYVASMSYAKNNATEIGNGTERFTGRLAVGIELSPKVRVDASISGSLSNTTGFAGAGIDPIGYSISTSRAIPAYNENGTPLFYQKRETYKYNEYTKETGLPYNISDNMANTGSRVENPSIQTTFDFKWRVLPELTAQVVAGATANTRMNESWMGENSFHVIRGYRGYRMGSPEAADPVMRGAAVLKNGGILITDNTYTRSYNVRSQLNYSHTFADIHRLSLMGMWEINSSYNNSKYNTVFGYDKFRGERIAVPTVPSELKPIGASRPSDYIETYLQLSKGYWRSTNFTDNKASLAMIVAYSINNKYVLNANFRNDWSNTFGQNANKRFNPAYSVGVSWKLAEEPFMESTKDVLNLANFRITYGTQGNVANTQTTEMILQYKPVHSILEEPYSAISRIANPYMTWERTTNWNGGLDMGFFKNRLTFVIDGYTRLSNAGRSYTDTPENGGFQSTLTGTYIRNSGIEGSINITPIQTNGWRISLGANFSKNWSKIEREEQPDVVAISTSNYIAGASNKVIVEGYPLGAFWAYSYAGPHPDYGIPTFNYIHAGEYAPNEKTSKPTDFLIYAGTRISDISGGLNLRIGYKKVSINSQFAATLGGNRFLSNPYSSFTNGRMPEPTDNLSNELLQGWTKNNRDSYFPGLYIVPDETANPVFLDDPSGVKSVNRYSMWAQSDARIASMSSLRCRSINATWNISSNGTGSFLKKMHVRSIDLTFAVNNVFLIADSKWNGMDPDLGGDRKAPRSYTMGVNFGF